MGAGAGRPRAAGRQQRRSAPGRLGTEFTVGRGGRVEGGQGWGVRGGERAIRTRGCLWGCWGGGRSGPATEPSCSLLCAAASANYVGALLAGQSSTHVNRRCRCPPPRPVQDSRRVPRPPCRRLWVPLPTHAPCRTALALVSLLNFADCSPPPCPPASAPPSFAGRACHLHPPFRVTPVPEVPISLVVQRPL